jgi:hypothetical protein
MVLEYFEDLYVKARRRSEIQEAVDLGEEPIIDLGIDEIYYTEDRETLEEISDPVYYRNQNGTYDCFFYYNVFIEESFSGEPAFQKVGTYHINLNPKIRNGVFGSFDNEFESDFNDWLELNFRIDEIFMRVHTRNLLERSLKEKLLQDPVVGSFSKGKYF